MVDNTCCLIDIYHFMYITGKLNTTLASIIVTVSATMHREFALCLISLMLSHILQIEFLCAATTWRFYKPEGLTDANYSSRNASKAE